jgi:hypothetical protein
MTMISLPSRARSCAQKAPSPSQRARGHRADAGRGSKVAAWSKDAGNW